MKPGHFTVESMLGNALHERVCVGYTKLVGRIVMRRDDI